MAYGPVVEGVLQLGALKRDFVDLWLGGQESLEKSRRHVTHGGGWLGEGCGGRWDDEDGRAWDSGDDEEQERSRVGVEGIRRW
uniref:Uncharacterized protein n=1 Tax=Arundo donax TaxID=35708 RepID=A0A0A9HJJ6_ARUDO